MPCILNQEATQVGFERVSKAEFTLQRAFIKVVEHDAGLPNGRFKTSIAICRVLQTAGYRSLSKLAEP